MSNFFTMISSENFYQGLQHRALQGPNAGESIAELLPLTGTGHRLATTSIYPTAGL
jgi:hypothetical protein